ncbi:hypothetical protein P389DRAFT_97333 [Cystobasidium minutum MCA 4210]|uniref:uncharacterized protein n=1 Tax=Cystobasidium minutum MCA 4210 TaxID=1397322 RepID=UPI0034CFD355|eukprot:jgi/Rhomi1/97333/CE97332_81
MLYQHTIFLGSRCFGKTNVLTILPASPLDVRYYLDLSICKASCLLSSSSMRLFFHYCLPAWYYLGCVSQAKEEIGLFLLGSTSLSSRCWLLFYIFGLSFYLCYQISLRKLKLLIPIVIRPSKKHQIHQKGLHENPQPQHVVVSKTSNNKQTKS